jgi:hypothetical protein
VSLTIILDNKVIWRYIPHIKIQDTKHHPNDDE